MATMQISVSLEKDAIKKIDNYANKLSLTRSTFVRNLIMLGLEDMTILNAVGLVNVVGLVRKMKDQLEAKTDVRLKGSKC